MKRGKRYTQAHTLVAEKKKYTLAEAVDRVKKSATADFDESIEIALKLNVNPKRAEQNIRATVLLPHGTGKSKRVAVIAKGEKQNEAKAAGADLVGADELVAEIASGKLNFDVLVATPDMMKDLGKWGKVLGPKGLMPNPKSGTVTLDVGKIVKEVKAGKIEFRVDAYGIIHNVVGKASFPIENLLQNAQTFIEAVARTRPSTVKGSFVQTISLCSTMGPGVAIDLADVIK